SAWTIRAIRETNGEGDGPPAEEVSRRRGSIDTLAFARNFDEIAELASEPDHSHQTALEVPKVTSVDPFNFLVDDAGATQRRACGGCLACCRKSASCWAALVRAVG